ncbi:hypothetical protein T492DRAFT_887150 [Pavlovales sp. CCMP2436]|nr:hypothetical protein T492DRAFT_887150 [Pavlovales sp. CCMP2436]
MEPAGVGSGGGAGSCWGTERPGSEAEEELWQRQLPSEELPSSSEGATLLGSEQQGRAAPQLAAEAAGRQATPPEYGAPASGGSVFVRVPSGWEPGRTLSVQLATSTGAQRLVVTVPPTARVGALLCVDLPSSSQLASSRWQLEMVTLRVIAPLDALPGQSIGVNAAGRYILVRLPDDPGQIAGRGPPASSESQPRPGARGPYRQFDDSLATTELYI